MDDTVNGLSSTVHHPMIQLETTPYPFSIVFKKNNVLLMTVRIHSDSKPDLRADSSSVTATFPRFTLNLSLLADQWRLTTSPADVPVEIHIELPGHWYGHGELINQHWPLNRIMLQSAPMHTFDNGPTGLSGVMNPAWFSSNGTLIIADSPVEVGINQPPVDYPRYKWSFSSEGRGPFEDRPFYDPGLLGDGLFTFKGDVIDLKFSFSENAVTAYEKMSAHFGHAKEIPPESLFEKPTWTTWARYKTAIDQDVVLAYADDIIKNDYPYGVMEIDDRWQIYYGDLGFDPKRFPDPKGMIDELHAKGFKVTAWVIPFLDAESQAFADGSKNGWLVRRSDGSPYLVEWWQGHGGLLDVTNPSALEWFFERLKQLQVKTGLDGFKFDAGEACFLPADAVTHQKIHPNEYTQKYVDAVSRHYQLTEVRSGWKNQRAPIFFRQWDKTTSWGLDNGLHSVLTGILALGMAGYPFILPDMIGGNEYEEKADAEMMIRWTQLNALLPAMQFSLPPWEYGEESTAICREYAKLHTEYAPKILQIAKESIESGYPIIRPIFWASPNDERALTCDDEFLLGDDILVAPVVFANIRRRDIYLPHGSWRDYWTGEVFSGSCILKNYPAPLENLLFFEKISS
jgi:alpha-glucosidase (family GH31 glycosyl hydrolase)